MRSAACPSRVWGSTMAPSHRPICAGSEAKASKVTLPTNRVARSVRTGATWMPASTSRRQISTALYAAMPAPTPSTTKGASVRASLTRLLLWRQTAPLCGCERHRCLAPGPAFDGLVDSLVRDGELPFRLFTDQQSQGGRFGQCHLFGIGSGVGRLSGRHFL